MNPQGDPGSLLSSVDGRRCAMTVPSILLSPRERNPTGVSVRPGRRVARVRGAESPFIIIGENAGKVPFRVELAASEGRARGGTPGKSVIHAMSNLTGRSLGSPGPNAEEGRARRGPGATRGVVSRGSER